MVIPLVIPLPNKHLPLTLRKSVVSGIKHYQKTRLITHHLMLFSRNFFQVDFGTPQKIYDQRLVTLASHALQPMLQTYLGVTSM